jgi:5-methylcytosine-specific restriction endonuclease McrA
MPLEWIDFRQAVRLHCLGLVTYAWGNTLFRLRGGINARTRQRSVIEVNSIIATRGHGHAFAKLRPDYVPPLNNRALFRRDDHICMYCGERFPQRRLSRDHVRPLSQGGSDAWKNVVTACVRCNGHKAGRTPEQAGLELIAIPFVPTHAEYIYLQGRSVLADQMAFLRAHFPRTSPLHERTARR